MKIAIFGLGNFGNSLAIFLENTGNEVIAIDKDPNKIDRIRDKTSHAVIMDSRNLNVYPTLPLANTDIAVIAMSGDEGTAIMTTAIAKKYCKGKIYARSSSATQDRIFEAIGIDQILKPEQQYAEQLTKKINLKGSLDNFELEGNYLVSEVKLINSLIGKTIAETDFRKRFELNIITIIRNTRKANLFGRQIEKKEVIGMVKPEMRFIKNDILVVFGKNISIEKYLYLLN